MSETTATKHKCQFCSKEFSKESTLAVHLCEEKRRFQTRGDKAVVLAMSVWLRFYEMTQGSARLKTWDDFEKSSLYQAFVKFGRYRLNVACPNTLAYAEWLIKGNKKIDYHWTSDKQYEQWLLEYVRIEDYKDALDRAVRTMEDYAQENTDLASFKDYFRYGNTNKILNHITSGRITAWTILNSDSGHEFVSRLDEKQQEIAYPWIDPDKWIKKFQDYPANQEHAQMILKEAGL